MAAAKFSWAAAADVGLGLAGAVASWGAASAQSIVSKANAKAANKVRTAQNEQRAASLSLAAAVRSMGDDAILTNAGDASDNAAVLIARTQESWTRGNFEQGLRDMEALGALTARASAAGVGGASVQAVSSSLRLAQARRDERRDEQQQEQTYEMLKQRTGIMPAAVSRMDLSPLQANMDYSTNVAGSSSPSLIGSLMEGLLKKKDSLQVALDSIPKATTQTTLPTGDFARMDRASYAPISIEGATTSPVLIRNPVGTPLVPITIN